MVQNGTKTTINNPDSQPKTWISYTRPGVYEHLLNIEPKARAAGCSDGEGAPTRRGCSDAARVLRRSRIQEKLTNTEEAHEYRRSSRVQEKLTNTAEAPRSEQKPQGASRSPHTEQKPPIEKSLFIEILKCKFRKNRRSGRSRCDEPSKVEEKMWVCFNESSGDLP